MICAKCKSEVRRAARFCPHCGNPVVQPEIPPRQALLNNLLLAVIIVLLLILVVESVGGGGAGPGPLLAPVRNMGE
ncbi:MAG: zinc-ribbon domain-containing protein [Pseudomonadota bacterium]